MTTHHLKTWPEYFQAVATGEKTFEVRVNDRNFQPGDTLILEEYDPAAKAYTGDTVTRRVWYVMPGGNFGIAPEMVVMSLFPPGTGDKFMDQLHRLADMAERLNALMMRVAPKSWGKDLVKATEEYIAELLRRRRADNDVFFRMFEEHHVIGLSLADVQEMRKRRYEEIVKEGEE